jgi:hypothetical protein
MAYVALAVLNEPIGVNGFNDIIAVNVELILFQSLNLLTHHT